MSIGRLISAAMSLFVLAVLTCAQEPASPGSAAPYNIDSFLATVDINRDASLAADEWKGMGLMDISFPLCDADKNGRITKQEMTACAIPEANDTKKEGILTVYGKGRFVIRSQGTPIPKPKNAPPGITQATQFVSDSPYMEGGPAGEDFIKLFDKDGDGKVSHTEWESLKNNTVFRPHRWPQYNRNRDQWITVEEAPKAPAK